MKISLSKFMKKKPLKTGVGKSSAIDEIEN